MSKPRIYIELPPWVTTFLSKKPLSYPNTEARMQLAIDLAEENIRQKTGGPFGAAIFDLKTNTLVAPGINLVISAQSSILHAEITAILIAQQTLKTYNLSGISTLQLVSSTEPCTMCLGAIIWSGIKQIITGATDQDAKEIGFDEGPKPLDWMSELNQREISVKSCILRENAIKILNKYHQENGIIY